MEHTVFDSPMGRIKLTEDHGALTALHFTRTSPLLPPATPLLIRAVRELKEYFSGTRREFSLPLAPAGTDFQKTVWQALCRIPYGATITYAQLSAQLGKPLAARAVGNANGKNPLPILIPCHRVIRGDGRLGG